MHLHTHAHELIHTRACTQTRKHLGKPGDERARDQSTRALPLQLGRPHHLTCVYVCTSVCLRACMSACQRVYETTLFEAETARGCRGYERHLCYHMRHRMA